MDSMSGLTASETPRFLNPLPIPTIEEQLASIVEDGRETLYLCPSPWALRHRFVNRATGEVRRARCDSWHCLYCGPRKVDVWRQLVKAVEPTLFVTLTKVGWTVEEAARVLTTVVQRLRRGYRSNDPTRKGYREAYPIEYFAVLERHSDFEQNGFHWHLLIKGVDFLPNQVVSDALRSATKGRSYITKTEGIHNSASIGYVTKYLTKYITDAEKGIKQQECERVVLDLDADGKLVEQVVKETIEVVSKARRIRCSRHFFPVPVEQLRKRLFSHLDADETGEQEVAAVAVQPEETQAISEVPAAVDVADEGEIEQKEAPASGWALLSRWDYTDNVEIYRQRKAMALREEVEDRRARGARHNGRILTLWDYQRRERRESFAAQQNRVQREAS